MFKFIWNDLKEIRKFFHRKFYSSKNNQTLINDFHEFYHNSGVYHNVFWFGVPVWKVPFDLWIYQEILNEVKPDLIIETGTAHGGSALYLANMLDLIGKGQIISVDIKQKENLPKHKRITYLEGSSVSEEILSKLKDLVSKSKKVIVILDSDHSKDHVLKELEHYKDFVSQNSYLIVEDSCVNGHPVWKDFGPGPMEAILEFTQNNKSFKIDKSKEKLFITSNPNGYLKRTN